MGQSKGSNTLKPWEYPNFEEGNDFVKPWPGFTCPRCGRKGVYAGTNGYGCTDCDNYFSHGLLDPLTCKTCQGRGVIWEGSRGRSCPDCMEHRQTRFTPPQKGKDV